MAGSIDCGSFSSVSLCKSPTTRVDNGTPDFFIVQIPHRALQKSEQIVGLSSAPSFWVSWRRSSCQQTFAEAVG